MKGQIGSAHIPAIGEKNNRTQAPSSSTRCFNCGEPGHRMAECKKGSRYGKGLFIDQGGDFEEQLNDT